MDFAGYIEATLWEAEDGNYNKEYSIVYVVSITLNGVDFEKTNYCSLEEAFNYIEEYNKQRKRQILDKAASDTRS